MPPRLACFVTHIYSEAPTEKTTGTGNISSDGTTLTDAVANFTGDGVVAGDVVRLTGPDTVRSQAAVVKSVTGTTLTFYVPFAARSVTATYRVEAPRQATDVSDDVIRVQLKDYLAELTQSVVIELANTDGQYHDVFKSRDPVELWIDDDDPDTPTVTFPSSTTDTSNDVENSRCFVGRIDRIELDESNQEVLRVHLRDYHADVLDTPVDAVFINTPMLRVLPSGTEVETNVVEKLQEAYNGIDDDLVEDVDDDYKTGKCGVMRDRATGRPTFDLVASDASAGECTNPIGDIAFATESFFDAFAKVAGACTQVTGGDFTGEPLKFWVDSHTYHPRRQDRTGVGEDDPRPPPGANPGAGNPTIHIETPQAATGDPVNVTLEEGVNLLELRPLVDSERTRNTITLLGTRNDDAPVVIRRRESGSSVDAFGQDVLGRDRYGELGNVAQARGLFDDTAAEAVADATLLRTRTAKQRRQLTRTMSIVPGRRLSGAVVPVTSSTLGLTAADFGVAGVTHVWESNGLRSEFDLTFIRPGWDRLLAPIEKSTRDIIREDVWRAWYVVIMDVDDSTYDLTFSKVPTHEFGDTTEETVLYTITNPDQGTYPTSNGNPWVPGGFHFYNGLLLITWTNPVDVSGDFQILFQLLNAYDGTPAIGSDGIYATMDDGVTDIQFEAAGGPRPRDTWIETHVNPSTNPTIESHLVVWIGSGVRVHRYELRRTAQRVIDDIEILLPVPDVVGGDRYDGPFFLETRDDGHLIYHGVILDAPSEKFWTTVDLSEPAPQAELQDEIVPLDTLVHSAISNRSPSGLAVFMQDPASSPLNSEMYLKMNRRWGDTAWQRSLGTGASRTLSVADDPNVPVAVIEDVVGRVEIVPYTRFWFNL